MCSIQQEEVKTHTFCLILCMVLVKVAKLQGDPECPCLVASSVYDIDETCACALS